MHGGSRVRLQIWDIHGMVGYDRLDYPVVFLHTLLFGGCLFQANYLLNFLLLYLPRLLSFGSRSAGSADQPSRWWKAKEICFPAKAVLPSQARSHMIGSLPDLGHRS